MEQTSQQNTLYYCNNCNSELADVKWCQNCKTVTRNVSNKFCEKCGQSMSDAKYCSNCKKIVKAIKKPDTNRNTQAQQINQTSYVDEKITLMSAHKKMFKNYTNFNGRARRKEYWLASIAVGIISFVLLMLMYIPLLFYIDTEEIIWAIIMIVPGLASTAYCIAAIIPALALTVRRLHDIGKSGWFMLLGLIPYVGSIILFVFSVMDSQPGYNQYGPNPKYR